MLSQAQPQAPHNEQKMNLASVQTQVSKPTVLVLGDSLSAAYGIDAEQGWVNLMSKEISPAKVVNASISGETTSGGAQRLPSLMQTHQPSLLIIELGANDALRGQDLRVTQSNLEKMAKSCLNASHNCQVVLLGVRLPTNYGPVYEQLFQKMYRDIANKYSLLFDPFFIEPVALDPELMQADALHPNAAAQPLIKQRVLPLIKQAIERIEEQEQQS